jgi:hypothetical protein
MILLFQVGRAKKRQQYNRRYVNVVVGPGKKKGIDKSTAIIIQK